MPPRGAAPHLYIYIYPKPNIPKSPNVKFQTLPCLPAAPCMACRYGVTCRTAAHGVACRATAQKKQQQKEYQIKQILYIYIYLGK